MICKICNKEFENNQSFGFHIKKHKIKMKDYYLKYVGPKGICPVCGRETKFISLENGFQKFCCRSCSNKSEESKYKSKQTCLKRYGVENPFQSEEIKEKIKQTNLNNLGVTNPSKCRKIKEKTKQTCLKKYGGTAPSCDKKIKEKMKITNIKKYGCNTPSKNIKVIKKIKNSFKNNFFNKLINSDRLKGLCTPVFGENNYDKVSDTYLWKCDICSHIFTSNLDNGKIPRCPKCYPYYKSTFEQEIAKFCKQYFPDLIENDYTILKNKELDIYIPEISFSIECNGLYWHSDLQGKDKDYHLNKTLQCEEKGIRLIHIFEDEWAEDKNRIKKILLKEMGIIERQTIFNDKMIADRRFSNGEYLLENGYELVEIVEPRCYYIYRNKRFRKEIKDTYRIWDCGSIIYKKI